MEHGSQLVERFDLHTHTRASDGMNSPTEQVRLAIEKGLAGLAITDHDTVAGIDEALRAGADYGVLIIPGIEISTVAEGKDIHVLGYFIDWQDERFQSRLLSLQAAREQRNQMILTKLRELGISIEESELKNNPDRPLRPGESIGRPHIADVLIKKGYADNLQDAFERYLGEGKPAYASVPRISPIEAIGWIREAGGAPVLAHPALYNDDLLVQRILEQGKPTGIEVFHSDHGPEEEARYIDMAERYGLVPTGGSDYHGVRQGVVFHGDLGSRYVGADVLDKLSNQKNS